MRLTGGGISQQKAEPITKREYDIKLLVIRDLASTIRKLQDKN